MSSLKEENVLYLLLPSCDSAVSDIYQALLIFIKFINWFTEGKRWIWTENFWKWICSFQKEKRHSNIKLYLYSLIYICHFHAELENKTNIKEAKLEIEKTVSRDGCFVCAWIKLYRKIFPLVFQLCESINYFCVS